MLIFRFCPIFLVLLKRGRVGVKFLAASVQCWVWMAIISYHQKGSWFKWQDISKLISRPSTAVIYGWMNLYSKNYENSNPRKPIQGIKLSELQKKVLFQIENHFVGHLMPKASHPWEKNGMT